MRNKWITDGSVPDTERVVLVSLGGGAIYTGFFQRKWAYSAGHLIKSDVLAWRDIDDIRKELHQDR